MAYPFPPPPSDRNEDEILWRRMFGPPPPRPNPLLDAFSMSDLYRSIENMILGEIENMIFGELYRDREEKNNIEWLRKRPAKIKMPKRARNWHRTRAQTTREHMRCGRFDWE